MTREVAKWRKQSRVRWVRFQQNGLVKEIITEGSYKELMRSPRMCKIKVTAHGLLGNKGDQGHVS